VDHVGQVAVLADLSVDLEDQPQFGETVEFLGVEQEQGGPPG
jgi:hypothetical protein